MNKWGLYLDDGRVEMDSNPVENLIRPLALNRKNSLFASHDEGAQNWARLASLIATCKLNGGDLWRKAAFWHTRVVQMGLRIFDATFVVSGCRFTRSLDHR